MCVIMVAGDESKLPTREELHLAEKANPDGAGAAWVQNKMVHWIKGSTAKEISDLLEDGIIKTPAVFHFRIATIGGDGPELTHPFPISAEVGLSYNGIANAVLFHNGHWGGWKNTVEKVMFMGKRLPAGPWSDSRAMAWLAHHLGIGALEILLNNDRVVVLSKKGPLFFGTGWNKYDDRFWASNRSWEPKKETSYFPVGFSGHYYFGGSDYREDKLAHKRISQGSDKFGDFILDSQGNKAYLSKKARKKLVERERQKEFEKDTKVIPSSAPSQEEIIIDMTQDLPIEDSLALTYENEEKELEVLPELYTDTSGHIVEGKPSGDSD